MKAITVRIPAPHYDIYEILHQRIRNLGFVLDLRISRDSGACLRGIDIMGVFTTRKRTAGIFTMSGIIFGVNARKHPGVNEYSPSDWLIMTDLDFQNLRYAMGCRLQGFFSLKIGYPPLVMSK